MPPEQKKQPDDESNGGLTQVSRQRQPIPRLPHERDQSSDSQQQPLSDERIDKAGEDLEQGRVDTGRSPVTEELTRRHFPRKKG